MLCKCAAEWVCAPTCCAANAATMFAVCCSLQVREIDLSGNTVRTILGTGSATNNGDNGLASAASTQGPSGLAVAVNGDIYVSTT